jgi:hypothetical protein
MTRWIIENVDALCLATCRSNIERLDRVEAYLARLDEIIDAVVDAKLAEALVIAAEREEPTEAAVA